MPSVFPDPRFRSPITIGNRAPHAHAFVRFFDLRKLETDIDLGQGKYEGMISSICGLGQEITSDHVLRIYNLDSFFDAQEKEPAFECDQLVLDYRRVNVETKISPTILFARNEKLRITIGAPMVIWLFGALQPLKEPPK